MRRIRTVSLVSPNGTTVRPRRKKIEMRGTERGMRLTSAEEIERHGHKVTTDLVQLFLAGWRRK